MFRHFVDDDRDRREGVREFLRALEGQAFVDPENVILAVAGNLAQEIGGLSAKEIPILSVRDILVPGRSSEQVEHRSKPGGRELKVSGDVGFDARVVELAGFFQVPLGRLGPTVFTRRRLVVLRRRRRIGPDGAAEEDDKKQQDRRVPERTVCNHDETPGSARRYGTHGHRVNARPSSTCRARLHAQMPGERS